MFGGCNPKSITTDNDIGFGKWKELEQMLRHFNIFLSPVSFMGKRIGGKLQQMATRICTKKDRFEIDLF